MLSLFVMNKSSGYMTSSTGVLCSLKAVPQIATATSTLLFFHPSVLFLATAFSSVLPFQFGSLWFWNESAFLESEV